MFISKDCSIFVAVIHSIHESVMKTKYIFIFAALALAACNSKTDHQLALERVAHAEQLAADGMLNQAKIELDSVHILYRMEVDVRKQAKQLQDSISYVEAKRNLVYADSLLQILTPQVAPLLKKFRYEKNEKYESNGRYVHRLLQTDQNTERCYLQAYVSDDRKATIKSYYCGTTELHQEEIELTANEFVTSFKGTAHSFSSENRYSILSFDGEKALEVLNFVSANKDARIRVNLIGKNASENATNYVYYINENEKKALEETYQLAILFSDIRQLEDMIRLSNALVGKYEQKMMGALPE